MKVFATQTTIDYHRLQLPVLDHPSIRKAAARGTIIDPLEQLISAFNGDEARSIQEMRTRSLRLLSISGALKTWAVSQVKICARKA